MSQISGSRANPIRSGMLRPSALQSFNNSTAGESGGSSVLKSSVLKPSIFKLGNEDGEPPATGSKSEEPAITESDEKGAEPTKVSLETESAPASSTKSASPAKVSNPFLLNITAEDEDTSTTEDSSSNPGNKDKKEKRDPMSVLAKNGIQKSNLFASAKTSIPLTDNSGFVFGQNVHERVTGESIQNADHSKNDTGNASESSTSSELFAIVGRTNNTDPNNKPVEASVEDLSEVARVYEESRAQKRKYDEVETFTGEENEKNVLDVNCKFFAFVASNWEERGPGSLRVNDANDRKKGSRVVFRTSGNLRVLLNTKIWPGMVVERPSQKSLRLTAIDTAGQVKIFLVMARPDDITDLYIAISKRIDLEKNRVISDDDSSDEPSPKKPAITIENVDSSSSST